MSGSELPLCEQVRDQREYPVLIQIDGSKTFAVNFSQEFSITSRDATLKDIHAEEHYYDFVRDLGLKGYEQFVLPYYAHKFMQALPSGQQNLSKD